MPLVTGGNGAVITGAASGIGKAAAERLAALGMRLVLADRDEAKLAAVAGNLATEVRPVACDVSRFEDVERLRNAAFSAFGSVKCSHEQCRNPRHWQRQLDRARRLAEDH